MPVYINGTKILDLKTIGLDPSKVYTKEEIDAKLEEYQKSLRPMNDNEIILLCDGGSSVTVSAITGDIGMSNPGELPTYTASGTVDIGKGWSIVTIDGNNSVNYDSTTGIATFRIYSKFKNTKVFATIKYI